MYINPIITERFPAEPYMIILGTSHTAGDCRDGESEKVDHSYGELLADWLGLKFVNLGMPGASNFDLMEIANELVAAGVLKNCAMLLLEPRLGSGTINISRDPVLEYYHNSMFQSHDAVHPSLFTTEHFLDQLLVHQPTTTYSYFSVWPGSDLNVANMRRWIANGYAENAGHITDLELQEFADYIKKKLYYESNTSYTKLHDLTVIHSIKNIVMGAGVPKFGWFNFGGAPANHPMIDDIYQYYLPLGHCPAGSFNKRDLSIMSYIADHYSPEFVTNNQCVCGHFNQQVHAVIADILYERLHGTTDN